MTPEQDYTAEQIQVLEGLEAVRKRPAMYIGDVSKRGLHHLVFEVVDNSIDEALAGYCNEIEVVLNKDNSISISDNGRGIPVETHKSGKSALEVVTTMLHAGGKFEKKAYQVSGGLHGVGISVVNALSERMDAEVHRNGKIHVQSYSRGMPQSEVKVVGDTGKTGTTIRFRQDTQIFGEQNFDYNYLKERLMELAFLNAGLKITFKDEREGGKSEVFHYEGGLREFVEYLNKARTKIQSPFFYQKKVNDVDVEYSIQYTDTYNELMYSFVNDIKTIEGGTHVTGFKTALTRAMNEYLKTAGYLKGDKRIMGNDVLEGLTVVLSLKVPEPQFEGQTKTKLGNSEIKGLVDRTVYDSFRMFLEENPSDARAIATKIMKSMQAREAAQKAKDLIRRKSVFESSILPGKLADCTESDPTKAELYLVEGDSAGGSSKQGRDRKHQAILPLRGKILNVEKAPLHRALANEEIKSLVLALGTGFRDEFDISKLRYHKVVIMSVDHEEPTVIMGPDGKIQLVKIGQFIDSHIDDYELNYKVLCFDVKTNKTTFKPIKKIIRHKISEPLFEIKTAYGRKIKVTSSHSLFSYENGKLKLKKTSELKEGDLIAAPSNLPLHQEHPEYLDLLEEFFGIKDKLDVDIFVRGESAIDVWKKRIMEKNKENPQLTESRVEIFSDLREEIRCARLDAGFSQSEVCDAVGIKQPVTFYSWEKGINKPILSHFKRYMDLLGLDEEKFDAKTKILPSKLEQIWGRDFKNSGCNIVKDRIRMKDLTKEDMQTIRDSKVSLSPFHYAHKPVKRFVPVNEELMFALGLFVAEGSCSQRNGVRFAIGNNNMRFAENFRKSLEKLFGTEAKLYIDKRNLGEVKILNSVISALFRHIFGFDKTYASSKRIPSIVFNSSKELQLAFLKGYLFGDGTVSSTGLCFSTSSKELANDLLYLLLANNIMASVSVYEPPKKNGMIRGKPAVTKLKSYRVSIVNRESLLKLKSVWKDHHLAHHLNNKVKSNHKFDHNRKFVKISSDLVGLPILSIKEIQPTRKMVYDFSVEEDENFIAGFGALCAHNTDADVDGAHIRTLLLTLFYRYFRPIIEKGHLYIAQPPLYKVRKGKELKYAYSDDELRKVLETMENPEIQRYKGLGEMNPEQLWETTMDPATRTLKQVTIEDAMDADELFSILMGVEVGPRREFIQTHAAEVKNLDV